MAQEINRICPYCGHKMKYDTYSMEKGKSPECIAYCDNEVCEVKPCTDATSATRVYQEILALTGDKELIMKTYNISLTETELNEILDILIRLKIII